MEQSDRVDRAQRQRLFYINNKILEEDAGVDFTVVGSTGNIYNVISLEKKWSCNCIDYKNRKAPCKHIYFVLLKVLKFAERDVMSSSPNSSTIGSSRVIEKLRMSNSVDEGTRLFNSRLIQQRLEDLSRQGNDKTNSKKRTVSQRELSEDNTCVICFDDMLQSENLTYCQYSCGKSVHQACFAVWVKTAKQKICCYCRSSMEPPPPPSSPSLNRSLFSKNASGKNENNYINVSDLV
jgi:hypothetical protein